jgi:ubiquinone/menaquinone biosynthesis C-methylase UbiE
MPFLKPEIITQAFAIIPGMRIVDFGCGSGYWTLELARHAGKHGKVYALDIQESTLAAVRSRVKSTGQENSIETAQINLEKLQSTKLADKAIDFILASNILFQISNKHALAMEAARILKHRGSIAVVDWDMSEALLGPSPLQKISRQDMEILFKNANLYLEKEFDAGSHHYGLLFRKI